ncbi:hypothetical protein ACLOJK_027164 [Asimina triloba]
MVASGTDEAAIVRLEEDLKLKISSKEAWEDWKLGRKLGDWVNFVIEDWLQISDDREDLTKSYNYTIIVDIRIVTVGPHRYRGRGLRLTDFLERFLQYYISDSEETRRAAEFMHLVQGKMSMGEYDIRFRSLSQFVPWALYDQREAAYSGATTMSGASAGKGIVATAATTGRAEANWANEEVELEYLEKISGQCEEVHEADAKEDKNLIGYGQESCVLSGSDQTLASGILLGKTGILLGRTGILIRDVEISYKFGFGAFEA